MKTEIEQENLKPRTVPLCTLDPGSLFYYKKSLEYNDPSLWVRVYVESIYDVLTVNLFTGEHRIESRDTPVIFIKKIKFSEIEF